MQKGSSRLACAALSFWLVLVYTGRVFAGPERGWSLPNITQQGGRGTFALVEALEKWLELFLVEDGTFCVSLPKGHPCLLQPGNLGGEQTVNVRPGKGPALTTGHPPEWTYPDVG